jgi:hypothetical protein
MLTRKGLGVMSLMHDDRLTQTITKSGLKGIVLIQSCQNSSMRCLV